MFPNRKCDVLNRGCSGYTSAFNKLILPRILQCDNSPKGSITVAVVLLGSNDSVLEDLDPRGTTVEHYVTNLTDILTQFMNDGIAASQLVLLTPPAISEVIYTKFCGEMGKQLQCPVVQRVDNAIHRINHYPVDSIVCFVTLIHWIVIYLADSVIHPLNNCGQEASLVSYRYCYMFCAPCQILVDGSGRSRCTQGRGVE